MLVLTVFDPSNPLTWFGSGAVVLGVMAVITLFVKEMVVPGVVYRRAVEAAEKRVEVAEKRTEAAESERREVQTRLDSMIDKVYPVLGDATRVLALYVEKRDASFVERTQPPERGRRS